MKANLDKCHFLSILDMSTKITVSIFDIENANLKKLLGVTIDRKLNFHDHVSNLYKKVSANTAQKLKFPIKDFFSKCDQICSFLRIWSHLLKKHLMENFIFCAVKNACHGESLPNENPIWLLSASR